MGLQSSKFFWSLIKQQPTTVPKMLQCTNQYMAAEALVAGKRQDHKRPHVDKVSWAALGGPEKVAQLPTMSTKSRPILRRPFLTNHVGYVSANPMPTSFGKSCRLSLDQSYSQPNCHASFGQDHKCYDETNERTSSYPEFFWLLIEQPPMTVPEMLQHTNRYMVAEVLVVGKREDHKRPHLLPRAMPLDSPEARLLLGGENDRVYPDLSDEGRYITIVKSTKRHQVSSNSNLRTGRQFAPPSKRRQRAYPRAIPPPNEHDRAQVDIDANHPKDVVGEEKDEMALVPPREANPEIPY
ncbi:hypothetical protein GW17_00059133 [Ensete ventricosum]|nr:hypothetical protein GW17_00059133 [Ensete ventricosum]